MIAHAPGMQVMRATWSVAPDDLRAFAARAHAEEDRARGLQGVEQFEVYRSADDDTHVFLYAQLRDLTLADALLAGAREVERSTWILAGSFHGADPSRVAEMPTGHVTSVQFSLKPGTLPRMLAAARSDIEQTGGIKRFDVAQNTSDPCRFHICARWVSRDAWEQHNATPEYAALAALLGELHVGPPIRTLWRALMPVPAEQRASR